MAKTGRLIIAHEVRMFGLLAAASKLDLVYPRAQAPQTNGFGAEIAAKIQEEGPHLSASKTPGNLHESHLP